MTLTAVTGYFPTDDSPESITASYSTIQRIRFSTTTRLLNICFLSGLDYDSSVQAIAKVVFQQHCTIFPQVQFSGKILAITKSGRTARLIWNYHRHSESAVFESASVWYNLLLPYKGMRAYHAPMIINLPLEERAVKAIGVALEIGFFLGVHILFLSLGRCSASHRRVRCSSSH